MQNISVIIPLYNKEKYVVTALQSILKQTHQNFEIIIVNDASTDQSVQKIEDFLNSKITLIHHEKNKGLAASRNTGIKKAKYNYVCFLDADDVWENTFLETINNLIYNFSEAAIFATNYQENWNGITKMPVNGSENLVTNFVGLINFFEINIKQGIYNHGSVCFDKKVFEKAGFYDEKIDLSQDLDFNIRANYYFKLAYDSSVQMTYYMQTENQLTRSNTQSKTIPNFDKYETWAKNNQDLKKYLDFERYVLAKRLKRNNDSRWKNMLKNINYTNLNYKQQILLKLPNFILAIIQNIKTILLKLGFKISTY